MKLETDILLILRNYRRLYMIELMDVKDRPMADHRRMNHAYTMYVLCRDHMRKIPSIPADYT